MHDTTQYPEMTKFLTESERSYIIDVLKQDSNNLSSRFDTQFFRQAIKDYKTYVQSLIYLRLLVLGYAIALFSPTIINELDYSAANAQLLSAPPFAAGCIGTIIFGIYSDKHNIRAYERTRRSSARGDLKRGIVIAMVIGFGNLGGICSCFIYIDPPHFHIGHGTIMGFLSLVIIMSLFAMWDYNRLNKKKEGQCEAENISDDRGYEFEDMGNDSPLFRCALYSLHNLSTLYSTPSYYLANSVAAAATAVSFLTGTSEPIFSSRLAPLSVSDQPLSPTPTGNTGQIRHVWSSLLHRLGLRTPGMGTPDVDKGTNRSSPRDAHELLLTEIARAFNLGLGLERPPAVPDVTNAKRPTSDYLIPSYLFLTTDKIDICQRRHEHLSTTDLTDQHRRSNRDLNVRHKAFGERNTFHQKGTQIKNIPLGDSDTVKWKWALSKPTMCSPNLADIWENQLTSIEDWITEEKKRAAMGSKINVCIAKSANDLQYADLIMLTSQCIYEKPEGKNASHDTTPRRTKRKITSEDSMVGQRSTAVSRTSMASSSANMTVPTPTADEVTPGALYDPRILPDYRGTYFQLQQNKLKQLNLYDTTENGLKLIPMHETYSKLRPGTLVLAVCDAHMYNMIQNGQPTSTFQLGMQAMKVLDPSDEPVEERFIPILSTTSVDLSKDDSAIAGFSTFDVAMNPAKKISEAYHDGSWHGVHSRVINSVRSTHYSEESQASLISVMPFQVSWSETCGKYDIFTSNALTRFAKLNSP
ncbi:uncharacterized protein F5891DRAFT_1172527 [Suillus fuscotomentosus]|uniref:Uncharacterized protein n=1 Tax=Suillus fuscotomentosus TaxID=1912939 RepID=A0AAD4E8Y8_9AGAM|nr:uncharacterized protein F5891DRAFT_1172527 [Suillus fuscotomentosus]KAG1901516.1 hypothetical protein F5891DRAFT_1172527 [Suillus fuscotomentosus]